MKNSGDVRKKISKGVYKFRDYPNLYEFAYQVDRRRRQYRMRVDTDREAIQLRQKHKDAYASYWGLTAAKGIAQGYNDACPICGRLLFKK